MRYHTNENVVQTEYDVRCVVVDSQVVKLSVQKLSVSESYKMELPLPSSASSAKVTHSFFNTKILQFVINYMKSLKDIYVLNAIKLISRWGILKFRSTPGSAILIEVRL